MAYQSLYRRYRSQRFDEVLGQDHVTMALRNAVREGRVAHGYLFSGPRGTGKTSTARILAKVLNCEAPVDGEPCTICDSCRAVEEGRSVDWLHELDAASNNKVDDMRDLLGRVSMGTSGNRKVYILDEVHMLSAGAANALLKTLEEPPAHVVFVLATTEPEKVLPTIRSRTQHFEFHLLGSDVLSDHVRHVIADAGLGLGEDAVEHVVTVGRGSARDTLSALDQVSAAGGVLDDSLPVDDLVDAVAANDPGAVLVAVDAAVRSGRDPRVLGAGVIEALRLAFLHVMGAPASNVTERAAGRAAQVADALGPANLTRAMEAVGTALVEMRHAPDARIPLEVALVTVARPEAGRDLDALVRRIEQLEQALASGAMPSTASSSATPGAAPPAPRPAAPMPAAADRSAASPARGAQAARERLARVDQPSEAASGAPAAGASGSRPSLGAMRARAAEAAPVSTTAPTPSEQVDAAPMAPDAAPTSTAPPAVAPEPSPAAGSAQPTPTVVEPAPTPEGAASDRSVEASSPASSDGLPTTAELMGAWTGSVLDALGGRAKALYRPGHFVDGDGRVARFALPNEHHLANCMGKLDEVRAAVSAHFGRPVPIELVVAAGGSSSTTPTTPTAGAAASAAADPDIDPDIDLDQLEDAPDPAAGGIAQLRDAFPGAELLEET